MSYFGSIAAFGACLTFPLFAIHSTGQYTTCTIEVSSEQSLLDEEVVIKFKNLFPREKIQIQAETTDDNHIVWKSFGLFEADDLGVIDLSKQSPLEGSYQGIDPMGLLWSMQPCTDEIGTSFKMKKEEYFLRITALRNNDVIAMQEISRARISSEVKRVPVQENGLVGALFLPPSDNLLPVIITLSGSNGGLSENRASLLASHGFAVFALGYFGIEGLPENLEKIPMEYFENAIAWIHNHPLIDSSRIGIYGISRGGELALILGSLFPESFQAIVAIVPSSVINGRAETSTDSWYYKGKPLGAFAPIGKIDFSLDIGKDPSNPANTAHLFLEGMKDLQAFEKASIPVEKIQASLLVISGGDDQIWPSSLYSEQIQKRLQEKKSSIFFEWIDYPNAGHGINIPNLPQSGPAYFHPIAKRWLSIGGTPRGDQHASLDSWKKITLFFDQRLSKKNSE